MECELYSNTPLAALRGQSRSIISRLLNATKVIPSPSGLPRDWRGLSDIAGCTPSAHSGCADPTASVLAFWLRSQPTISDLVKALQQIDRWDVIDDSLECLESDAKDYAERLQVSSHPLVEEESSDDNILTVDDIQCIENCGQAQHYDAFLLYDDKDEEFAMTILDKLENEYKMKLCTKDRDLIGGLSFEHEAIMQLIKFRCGRLIVVVSPAFLNSPANSFLLSFAQALGIEQRQRKIIPCVYTNFQLPLQLRYYFVLNFGRTARQWNFWQQLSQSVRATNARMITAKEYTKPKPITYQSTAFEPVKEEIVKKPESAVKIEEIVEPKIEIFEPEKKQFNIEKPSTVHNEQKLVIKDDEATSVQCGDKSPTVSNSFFSKLFSSHSSIAKSLLKKKKKIAKVLAE